MIIKPHHCTALGCLNQTDKTKPFCQHHWDFLSNVMKSAIQKAEIKKEHEHGRYNKTYLASVFRAQTALGIKDNRIKESMKDRREWYAKHNIEGIKPNAD